MKLDRFWETFWVAFMAILLISVIGSAGIFFFHIQNINAAAVGVSFDSTKDPFEKQLYRSGSAVIVDGYAYRNALPLGAKQWAWDAQLNWNSAAVVYEGSAALKMVFLKPWSGMGLGGFALPRGNSRSISLAVFPDSSVGDLYLELYDSKGNSLGRQSLGWYTDAGSLKPNEWQLITIPLENLLGSSSTKTINGISISTKNAGTAYADAIQFGKTEIAHAVWVMPAGDGPPYNPFATSTPVALPYTASFSAQDFSQWFGYYGAFEFAENAFRFGPMPPQSTDSITVYRGGRFWSDYKVDVRADWGLTSVFSILVRFTDTANFASCAFSHYGQTAQIYQVVNGVSTELAQSPTLAIPDYQPWKDVHMGASVEGRKVSCYLNGERVLAAEIPSLSNNGTIGFEAWDQNPYASPHTLRTVEVRPLIGE